ncbi:MAG: DUF481 domain-containing protein [Gammaproteobacteria bacterium]|nr:DUF481 domain-containing protein [Gammaproteobacteria bacterium]MDJ0892153.1 DUF481 domain-containing protein [Gammaproteobacteria bacterium]
MRQSLSLALLLLLGLGPTAHADVVYMKNGDRITGRVLQKTAEKVLLKTAYAGKISIAWDEVQAFTTDKPVRLYFEDSGRAKAKVQRDASGNQILVKEDGEAGTPFTLGSLAYVNPPKHVSGEGYTWSGNVNFGFESERGNTDKDDYHLDGEIRVRGLRERYRLYGEFDRERSNNRTVKNQWKAIGSYSRDLRKKWYLFTNLFSEGDSKKDLEVRATASIGPGYRFFDTDDLSLSVEAGPGVTVERWDNDLEDDEEYATARWGVEYEHYVYKRFAQLFHRQNGVWNLEETSDYVLTTRTGVNFDLTKHLRSTFSYHYEYDNGAPRDRDKSDSKVIATVGYKW